MRKHRIDELKETLELTNIGPMVNEVFWRSMVLDPTGQHLSNYLDLITQITPNGMKRLGFGHQQLKDQMSYSPSGVLFSLWNHDGDDFQVFVTDQTFSKM